MKLKFAELEGCFSIDLDAETLEDAAFLVRFGINATSELRCATSYVDQNGSFGSAIVIGKRKQPTNEVQKP